jgi:hypothetical protein
MDPQKKDQKNVSQHMSIRLQVLKQQTFAEKPTKPTTTTTNELKAESNDTTEIPITLSQIKNITDEEYQSERDQQVREIGKYKNEQVFEKYFHDVLDKISAQRQIALLQRLDLNIDDVKQNRITNDQYETCLQKLIVEAQKKLDMDVPKAEHYDKIPYYRTVRLLGSGSFASAYLIVKDDENSRFSLDEDVTLPKDYKNIYVLKHLRYPKEEQHNKIVTNEMLKGINMEKIVGYCLSHPNITKFYGCYKTDYFVTILNEFIPCGTFNQIWDFDISQLDPCDNAALIKCYYKRMKFYSAQLILAIEYLHGLNMVHADISVSNVCIDYKGYAKLIDFGMVRFKDPKYRSGKLPRFIGIC